MDLSFIQSVFGIGILIAMLLYAFWLGKKQGAKDLARKDEELKAALTREADKLVRVKQEQANKCKLELAEKDYSRLAKALQAAYNPKYSDKPWKDVAKSTQNKWLKVAHCGSRFLQEEKGVATIHHIL